MAHLGLMADFKRQVIQWDGAELLMNEQRSFLGQFVLTGHDMRKMVMQTTEPASTRDYSEIMAKPLDSNYDKDDLEQFATNSVQLNAEQRIEIMIRINEFEDFFDVTIKKQDSQPVDLESNHGSKYVKSKY